MYVLPHLLLLQNVNSLNHTSDSGFYGEPYYCFNNDLRLIQQYKIITLRYYIINTVKIKET
ncbi:MAG: hypothetical protein ACJATI_004003 [Halioglobus sp.]|jgi:hypothetical protein